MKQYNFLCDLTGSYKIAFTDSQGMEYNDMIKQKIDEKLTGIYTIARINYTYDEQEGRLRQKIALFRREWPNTP